MVKIIKNKQVWRWVVVWSIEKWVLGLVCPYAATCYKPSYWQGKTPWLRYCIQHWVMVVESKHKSCHIMYINNCIWQNLRQILWKSDHCIKYMLMIFKFAHGTHKIVIRLICCFGFSNKINMILVCFEPNQAQKEFSWMTGTIFLMHHPAHNRVLLVSRHILLSFSPWVDEQRHPCRSCHSVKRHFWHQNIQLAILHLLR